MFRIVIAVCLGDFGQWIPSAQASDFVAIFDGLELGEDIVEIVCEWIKAVFVCLRFDGGFDFLVRKVETLSIECDESLFQRGFNCAHGDFSPTAVFEDFSAGIYHVPVRDDFVVMRGQPQVDQAFLNGGDGLEFGLFASQVDFEDVVFESRELYFYDGVCLVVAVGLIGTILLVLIYKVVDGAEGSLLGVGVESFD